MFRTKKAFTLVELLVVIAIIGVIATVSFVYYANSRAAARNAERVRDIKEIQTALELYRANEGHYPLSLMPGQSLVGETSSTTYMAAVPSSPRPTNDGNCTSSDYIYITFNNSLQYNLSFCLGENTGYLTAGPKCATPSGINDADCEKFGDSYSCPGIPVVHYAGGPYDSNGITTTTGGYYRTVKIGNQCWLRDNLNAGTKVPGSDDQGNYASGTQKYCYHNHEINLTPSDPDFGGCDTDGGLYQWHMAMGFNQVCDSQDTPPCVVPPGNIQGICPAGWHIPSDAEQNTLDQYLWDPSVSPYTCADDRDNAGDCANAGTKLRAGGSSGFNGLLAGLRYSGSFYYRGTNAYFWASSVDGPNAWRRGLATGDANVNRYNADRAYGFSVRCLKN